MVLLTRAGIVVCARDNRENRAPPEKDPIIRRRFELMLYMGLLLHRDEMPGLELVAEVFGGEEVARAAAGLDPSSAPQALSSASNESTFDGKLFSTNFWG